MISKEESSESHQKCEECICNASSNKLRDAIIYHGCYDAKTNKFWKKPLAEGQKDNKVIDDKIPHQFKNQILKIFKKNKKKKSITRFTICKTLHPLDQPTKIIYTISISHDKDVFCKKEGKNKALGRLIKLKKMIDNNSDLSTIDFEYVIEELTCE